MGDIYEVIDELRNTIEQRRIERQVNVNWRIVVRWGLAIAGGIAILITILIRSFY